MLALFTYQMDLQEVWRQTLSNFQCMQQKHFSLKVFTITKAMQACCNMSQ